MLPSGRISGSCVRGASGFGVTGDFGSNVDGTDPHPGLRDITNGLDVDILILGLYVEELFLIPSNFFFEKISF